MGWRERSMEREEEGREGNRGGAREGGNDGGRDIWIIVGAKAVREGGREGHREDRGNKRREGGSEWRMEGEKDQGGRGWRVADRTQRLILYWNG